jgi:hypothetical protein
MSLESNPPSNQNGPQDNANSEPVATLVGDLETQGNRYHSKGMDYLTGVGGEENAGMAVASFLDGADINHPQCALKAALAYYIGAGVTRNLATAKQYATKCMSIAPAIDDVATAKEILSESLGSENARRLLLGEVQAAAEEVADTKAAGNNRRTIVVAVATAIIVIGGVGGAIFLRTRAATEALKVAAVASLEQRDYLVATTKADAWSKAAPDSYDALYVLAQAKAQTGDNDGALVALKATIEKGFKDFKAIDQNVNLVPIRDLPAYESLMSASFPARPKKPDAGFATQPTQRSGTDTIAEPDQSPGVSVTAQPDGSTTIRAGDVVLEMPKN